MSASDHVDEILRDFDRRKGLLDELHGRVALLLHELLDDRGIRAHSVETRVKGRESLERKVRGRVPPYETLEAITDLVGARVITYFEDDVDTVKGLLEAEFEVDPANSHDLRKTIDRDRFGYVSVHDVVTLSPARAALPEWRRFVGMRFEIQMRSILQHAWAEIEHDRGYHVETDVPRAMRRRWSRVAALLELADTEFIALRNAIPEAAASRRTRPESRPPIDSRTHTVSVAVASAGTLEPGRASSGSVTVSIAFLVPVSESQALVKLTLDTPDVFFDGTPILTANVPASVSIGTSHRELTIEVAGHTAPVLPSFVFSGLHLRASVTALPGVTRASLTVDQGSPIAIPSLGTVGPVADVVVRAAAVPTVLSGRNAQSVGLVSISERRAGALSTPGSSKTVIRVRLMYGTNATGGEADRFSAPPWLVVTSGDIKLRADATGVGATAVQGVVPKDDPGSAEWQIFSSSTVASSLALVGATASGPFAVGPLNGPTVDATLSQTIGSLGILVETIDAVSLASDVRGFDIVAYRVWVAP